MQERWENPEEEYYTARHTSAAPMTGAKHSDSEELEIDAAPPGTSGRKARRMHPFGEGIRQGPLKAVDRQEHAVLPETWSSFYFAYNIV